MATTQPTRVPAEEAATHLRQMRGALRMCIYRAGHAPEQAAARSPRAPHGVEGVQPLQRHHQCEGIFRNMTGIGNDKSDSLSNKTHFVFCQRVGTDVLSNIRVRIRLNLLLIYRLL